MKDVVGIIHDIFAIIAFGLAGIWFCLQTPLTPGVKADIAPTVSQSPSDPSDVRRIDVKATFENIGHVKYEFNCWAIGLDAAPETYPSPDCSKHYVLYPGERRVFGTVFQVHLQPGTDVNYIRAEIGDVAATKNLWSDTARGSVQVIFLDPSSKVAVAEVKKQPQQTSPARTSGGPGDAKVHRPSTLGNPIQTRQHYEGAERKETHPTRDTPS